MIEPYPKLQGRGEFIQWAWEKRSHWPSDWDDKVFLGRALDLVGRAKFGADWTGRDPEGMPYIKALPDEWANAADHIRGPIAEQNWPDAVAGREEHRRLALASFARWNEVTGTMAGGLRGSGLAAFARGKKSNRFIPIDRQSFNLDDMHPLFKNLTLRIPTSYMDMTECWVFVDADDLAGIVAAATKGKPGNKAFDDDDAVMEMLAIMDAEGVSATEASKRVAPKAKGNGVESSTARRLYGKFQKAHPGRVEPRYKD